MRLIDIPFVYVFERASSLSWFDIETGYRRDVLSRADVSEYAIKVIAHTEPALQSDVALLVGGEDLSESEYDTALRRLGGRGSDERMSVEKWLTIGLNWIAENEDQLSNPLDLAQNLVIAIREGAYVPYMKWFGNVPGDHRMSREQKYRDGRYIALMNEWKSFLCEHRDKYVKVRS